MAYNLSKSSSLTGIKIKQADGPRMQVMMTGNVLPPIKTKGKVRETRNKRKNASKKK